MDWVVGIATLCGLSLPRFFADTNPNETTAPAMNAVAARMTLHERLDFDGDPPAAFESDLSYRLALIGKHSLSNHAEIVL